MKEKLTTDKLLDSTKIIKLNRNMWEKLIKLAKAHYIYIYMYNIYSI